MKPVLENNLNLLKSDNAEAINKLTMYTFNKKVLIRITCVRGRWTHLHLNNTFQGALQWTQSEVAGRVRTYRTGTSESSQRKLKAKVLCLFRPKQSKRLSKDRTGEICQSRRPQDHIYKSNCEQGMHAFLGRHPRASQASTYQQHNVAEC